MLYKIDDDCQVLLFVEMSRETEREFEWWKIGYSTWVGRENVNPTQK